MSGKRSKQSTGAGRKAAGASKARRGSAAATGSEIVDERPTEVFACTRCPKTYRSPRSLARHVADKHSVDPPAGAPPEIPVTEALEKMLEGVELSPRQLLLVAQLRRVTKALEECTPPSVEKLSKELTALRTELTREVTPRGDDDDWTAQGSGTS